MSYVDTFLGQLELFKTVAIDVHAHENARYLSPYCSLVSLASLQTAAD